MPKINNVNRSCKREKEIFTKPNNKKWVPLNNHHSTETFIEVTLNKTNEEVEKIQKC